MKTKIEIFITLIALVANSNCTISVRSTHKTGEVSKRVFEITAKNELDCKKMARGHKTNFAPQSISKVEVNSSWKKK